MSEREKLDIVERAERAEQERDEALAFGKAAAQQSTDNARRAERAEQEAAELRKDAERYRWLRDETAKFPAESCVVTMNIGHDWIALTDLDVAIDAALEGK